MEPPQSSSSIEQQMANRNYKTRRDVREIYYANRQLTSVRIDFHEFPYLTYLWLNGNQLTDIGCLKSCLNLAELYLHENHILTIQGCLGHLKSLQVLYLQKNKLQNLEITLNEMRHMLCLEMLNLAHNPLTQEKEYRLYTIAHSAPGLVTLDQAEVKPSERIQADKLVKPERLFIKERIAFGQRFLPNSGTTSIARLPTTSRTADTPAAANATPSDVNEIAEERRMKKSQFELTRFDWSRVPRFNALMGAEEKRIAMQEMTPEMITVRMKM